MLSQRQTVKMRLFSWVFKQLPKKVVVYSGSASFESYAIFSSADDICEKWPILHNTFINKYLQARTLERQKKTDKMKFVRSLFSSMLYFLICIMAWCVSTETCETLEGMKSPLETLDYLFSVILTGASCLKNSWEAEHSKCR